jgi:hypothetical protein
VRSERRHDLRNEDDPGAPARPADPGLGLSVDVPRRMLAFLQSATESYVVALRPPDR